MGFLIDTCIWVDVERGLLSPRDVYLLTGGEPVYISAVTIAELGFGAEMAADEGIRQRRMAALERLKRKPRIIIDEQTGAVFGRIAAVLKKQGRDSDFRIQDIWLASQAIQHGFNLLTFNEKDFSDIPGLNLSVYKKV